MKNFLPDESSSVSLTILLIRRPQILEGENAIDTIATVSAGPAGLMTAKTATEYILRVVVMGKIKDVLKLHVQT
jgi:hypothetical protein